MVDISDIRAAAARLAPVVRRTPLLESPFLNEIAGRRVLVKAECLQHTGSFKFRGAWSAISALDPEVRARGVFAYSSGNHAQGVAYAAKLHGIPAVILMPADAPKLKLANTAAFGAEVITYDRYSESREEIGARLAEERGLTLVRPYDEPMVIAGQGTTGLELAEQAAEAGVREADVLVCTGGGGLSSGVALALQAEAPGLRVRPVEPEDYDDWKVSLEVGARTPATGGRVSLCDAIVTPAPGEITWPILSRLAGPGIAVSDRECLDAMAQAFERLKIVIEPGGAAALAAALFRPEELSGEAVLCLATGGNVDRAVFAQALEGSGG
ncbi:threonine/serine dehydratase [uncultured Albimonas sp.]|uniref:threonine ammonia-lyase n=1 Tax=uncultured Albimonas sp. TaxID=1331701 RepID=UPI0030EB889A